MIEVLLLPADLDTNPARCR